jgi:hypothetical protein
MGPPRSAQAKERKNEQYYYDKSDEINDAIHGVASKAGL